MLLRINAQQGIHVIQGQGYTTGNYEAPYGGQFPGQPNRVASYQLNLTGQGIWQSWAGLRYKPGYNSPVHEPSQKFVQNLAKNNAIVQLSARPLPIQGYQIYTQQVLQRGGIHAL